jgi:hypothetical protein
MGQFHGKLVDRIVPTARPVGHIHSAGLQWSLWLVLSLGVMALALWRMKVGNSVETLGQMPPMAFILAAFLGAAVAAWEAVVSSIPGRHTGKWFRAAQLSLLAALVLIPFLFFPAGIGGGGVLSSLRCGVDCMKLISLVGLLPWILLGWMLSRNAAFNPAWTGAWSGVSAFLLGAVTVQLHCPNWETGHMLVSHLLPVAVLVFPATFAGSFWFSRWKKKI